MTSNQRHSIVKAAGLIAFFTLASRLVGLLRDRLFAAYFGPSEILDAYYAAFRLPDLIFNLLILGTLSAAFIPVFTEYFVKDEKEANTVANTILNVSFLAMALLCGILYLMVPQLTHLLAPGFEGEQFDNTVAFTKIFLLSPIIFTISNVFTSMLQSLKRFLLVSIAPIIYNLGIIFGIIFLYPRFGITGLAWGVILGAAGHMLIQIPGIIKAGFSFKPIVDLKHPALKKFTSLFLPRIIGVESSQVSLLIASIIGSTLITGSITIFNFANNLQAVAVGVFGLSFAIAAFPTLAEQFSQKDEQKFAESLGNTTVHILFFVIPISVLIILLRNQVVNVLFLTGKFDIEAANMTANTLGVFALSIFSQSLAPLYARAFYARHNTITPVLASLTALALNAVGSYYLGQRFGVIGLVLGFSIASIAQVFLLLFLLKTRMRLHHFGRSKSIFAIIFSSAIMGLVVFTALGIVDSFYTADTTLSALIEGGIGGILGVLIYIAATAYFKLPESKQILTVVKRYIFR